MYYLIGGENSYDSERALESLIDTYSKKGYEVTSRYVGDLNDVGELVQNSLNIGFFNTKRVIVVKAIEEADAKGREQLESLLDFDLELVLWTRKKFDKRSRLYKQLKKKGEVKEYKSRKGKDLDTWISSLASGKGVNVNSRLLKQITYRFGDDQYIIANELDKLKALVDEGIAPSEDVLKAISVESVEASIWDLIDTLTARKKAESLALIDKLSRDMEYEMMMGAIIRQLRLLFLASNMPSKNALTASGVHPFVASKLVRQISNTSIDRLKKLYSKLVDIEIAVRTGKLEKEVALDLFVIAF